MIRVTTETNLVELISQYGEVFNIDNVFYFESDNFGIEVIEFANFEAAIRLKHYADDIFEEIFEER